MHTLNITSLTPATDKPNGVFRLEYRSVSDQSSQWAFVWPNEKSRDWVIVIHGHGSQGDQLYTRPDLRDTWLPALVARGLNILTPNLRGNAWMSPHAAADMHALMQWLREYYAAERCFLASGSMGGTSNLIFAVLHPNDVAGVVALCPATDLSTYSTWCRSHCQKGDIREQIADAISDAYGGSSQDHPAVYRQHSALVNHQNLTMPTWVCHSTGDEIIPVDEAQRLAAALQSQPQFHYEEIPGGNHDSSLPRLIEGLNWVMTRC